MEKTMSLSDEREELERKVLSGEIDIRKVFHLIEKQDKQFIKELKEKLGNKLNFNHLIDELAGGEIDMTTDNQAYRNIDVKAATPKEVEDYNAQYEKEEMQ